jgi:hypothetical protein
MEAHGENSTPAWDSATIHEKRATGSPDREGRVRERAPQSGTSNKRAVRNLQAARIDPAGLPLMLRETMRTPPRGSVGWR